MEQKESSKTAEALPLACNLAAIAANERPAHYERADHLMSQAIQERLELADGYAFRYQADDYADLVAFVGNERLCCPFFHFTLEVSPAQGPIWLRITGGEGVKAFFVATLTGDQKVGKI